MHVSLARVIGKLIWTFWSAKPVNVRKVVSGFGHWYNGIYIIVTWLKTAEWLGWLQWMTSVWRVWKSMRKMDNGQYGIGHCEVHHWDCGWKQMQRMLSASWTISLLLCLIDNVFNRPTLTICNCGSNSDCSMTDSGCNCDYDSGTVLQLKPCLHT